MLKPAFLIYKKGTIILTNKVIHISYLEDYDEIVDLFMKSNNKYIICNKHLRDLSVDIDMENEEHKEEAINEVIDLILIILRNKYLKKYIWDNYKKLKDKEKEEIYKEANCLFDKKEPFIINTIYNKLTEVAESEKDLNIDGFFRFRMRDFMVYISIISDIAFEEYLIRKDKNQFINTLKFFIESQEQKIDLLIIHIMRNGDFRFYDKYGDEINNKESEEMMSMIMKEDLNLEDCLISVLLSLCPKKVEIIDDLKNETSKEIIENMKIIFEGNVNIVPKK